MVYAVLPFYLVSVLGASYIIIGIIEGFFELISNIIKIFSGYVSDFRKKKHILLYSFVLSIIGRLYLGFSKKWEDVAIYTIFESISEGSRTPQIDILLSYKKKPLGKIYGINRVFENFGGLLGIAVAFFSSFYFLTEEISYNLYFLLSVLPVFLSIFFVFMIKEKVKRKSISYEFKLQMLYPEYLLLFFVLSFANFGYSFYILKVYNYTENQSQTIALYMFFYIILMITSYISGRFFDRIGEKRFIKVSIFLFITAHLLMIYIPVAGFINFAIADAFIDIGVWAILGQKVKFRKGFVFGMYHFTIGISSLFSSFMAGYLWDNFGSEYPFLMGMFASVLALIIYTKILR